MFSVTLDEQFEPFHVPGVNVDTPLEEVISTSLAVADERQKLAVAREAVRGHEQRVAELEMRLASLMGRATTAGPRSPAASPAGGVAERAAREMADAVRYARGAGSQAHQIIQLLDEEPEADFTAPQISQKLGLDNLNSIRSTLVRLADEGRVARFSTGIYRSARGGKGGTAT